MSYDSMRNPEKYERNSNARAFSAEQQRTIDQHEKEDQCAREGHVPVRMSLSSFVCDRCNHCV